MTDKKFHPEFVSLRDVMNARREFKPKGSEKKVGLELPEPLESQPEDEANVVDFGRESLVRKLANLAETVEVEQVVPGVETTPAGRPNLTLIKDEFRWDDVKPEHQTHLIAAAKNAAEVNERGNSLDQVDPQERASQERPTA